MKYKDILAKKEQERAQDAPDPSPQDTPAKPSRRRSKRLEGLPADTPAPPVSEAGSAPPAALQAGATPAAQAALNEAYALPYDPPSYHFDDSDDPMCEFAARELCRRKLLPFIQRFRPKYMAGWVHEDICRRIERFVEQVERGESPRLLLLCPPRMGKSEIGSRHTPAWVLGKHPDWEIIAASHTSSLSLSFSRYLRDVMRDSAYTAVFPDTVLDSSSQSVENWNLTKGGGYMAAGVGTGITGRGCFLGNTPLQSLTHGSIMTVSTVSVGDYVYGYDHEKQKIRPVKVIAVSANRTNRSLCRVGDVVCTDDHEFCTDKQGGYTRAGEVTADMSFVRLTEGQVVEDVPSLLLTEPTDEVDRENLSEVWRGEGRARLCVQKMSHGGDSESRDLGVDLRQLPRGVSSEETRARGRSKEVWCSAYVLLQGVLSSLSKVKKAFARKLRAVRRTTVPLRSEEVLLPQVLLGEQKSCGEAAVQQRVLGLEEVAAHPEGSGVRHVRTEDLSSGGTPHRPRLNKQRGEELGVVVLSMSQVVSHLHGVSAERIEGCIEETDGQVVVDIQTETGNYFVGECGVLVHNCHILVVDDVVKDAEAAQSLTIRDNTWEWFLSTAYTRLAPGGGVLGILTWWHDDDWAGRIQQAMLSGDGDKYEIVKYPAINDQGDEYILPDDSVEQLAPTQVVPPGSRLTRPQGTAIHPARYTTEMMLRIKRNLIAGGQKRVWDALYQQNPVPDEGNFFSKEMFRYYGAAPARSELYVYQAWDFAISEGKESDYTVGTCIGVDFRDNVYVLDVRRFRSQDGGYIIDEILDFAALHNADCLGFEDGQIWKSLEFQFQKRCEERRQFPSHEVLKPLTDKMVRAGPLRGRMQLSKVYFDKNAAYFADVYKELLHFPAGKHDDCVDSLAWAVRLTLTRSAPRDSRREPKLKSWRDKLPGLMGDKGVSHMAA